VTEGLQIVTVLLAYDGKPHNEKVLDYAIGYALAYSSPLYIISSVASKDAADGESELNHAKNCLEAAKNKATERGVETFTLIGIGNPGEEIIATAGRIDADVIVVGHTDKTSIDRVIWGTVSEYVIRTANCIVIVVQ
jgi:nucleotide-binding universal stress UspA family protein